MTATELNNELRQVQQDRAAAQSQLAAEQQKHASVHSQAVTNWLEEYRARRAALWSGEQNEHNCNRKYPSNRKKREECTTALRTWVNNNTSKNTNYLNERKRTTAAIAQYKNAIAAYDAEEIALKDQIEAAQAVEMTLATQGQTAEAIKSAAEITAYNTAEAEKEAIQARTAAAVEQAKLDKQAKQTRNYFMIGFGALAFIIIAIIVYRKFIAKKKKGGAK